ncbi:MAG: hypothetical protein U1C04_18915 [Hydrogenophaga sp.]|uniref:hypothetical protein n=1 Tax=Hydrogenophaga sp. TaxID=1904254 RepID=UPI002AB9371B|nr:hypothetical protein [Hydrogenophaga sp.]MDZ4282823.1 hypothetical protein [Hydrogenophaga sp.]
MSNEVIWFDSSEVGAPTLTNAAGSLVEILRACLINGFGSKSVTSISVTSGVATATCAAHGFSDKYGKLVLVAGSSEALLNGRKQIGGITTNTFTFPAPGVANGTYSGTVTAKRAPLGWVEAHSGTNKAIFARSVPEANAQMLRVDDTTTAPSSVTDARALIVESATGVDAYTNPAPTEALLSGGTYIHKGSNIATAKPWVIVGGDRFFYLVTANNPTPTTYQYSPYYFGDGVAYQTPDPYFTMLAGNNLTNNPTNSRSADLTSPAVGPTVSSRVLSRNFAASLVSARFNPIGTGAAGNIGGASNGQISTTSVVVQSPVMVLEEGSDFLIRGAIPGLANPLARVPFAALPQFSIVEVFGSSRKFLSVLYTCSSVQGNLLIDLTGPWY